MSSVVISGDTSGAITLAAPSVAGTNTITLPASTGTAMVSGNMPAFSAYQSSNQTLSNGTWAKVTCQTKEFDTNSYYDNSTNYRFTPLVSGYYQVSGSCQSSTATTQTAISIYKNGSDFKSSVIGGANCSATISALIYFNGSTDYVELYVNLSGVSPQTTASQARTYFQAAMIRSA